MKGITLAAMAVSLAGCAALTRGTEEDVSIQVSPQTAQVALSTGQQCIGPCVVKVSRKQSFTATASAPGYDPQSVAVGTRVSGGGGTALAGNLVFGGLIGAGVDIASGATLDHYPNPVVLALQPVGAGGPRVREPVPTVGVPVATVAPTAPPKPKFKTLPNGVIVPG